MEAKALIEASASQIECFQYGAALASAESGSALALRVGDDSLAGAAAHNLGQIYSQLGDFSSAERRAKEAVALLRQSPPKDYLAMALLSYASIQVQQGKLQDGIETYSEAIAVAQQAKLLGKESEALDSLGRSYLDACEQSEQGNSDDLRHAEIALTKAHQLESRTHDGLLAVTMTNEAELEYRTGKASAALKLIDTAFASHSTDFFTSPQYEPVHLRAQILSALGRTPEALKDFRRAFELATEWRHNALPGDATSTRTVSHLHDVVQDYVEFAAGLALKRHDDLLMREAWAALAASRAANLREQLTLAFDRAGRLPPRYFELLSQLQDAQARFTLGQNLKTERKLTKLGLS